MTDSWEDWEDENFIPSLHKNEEQMRKLEERKLVEESDHMLAEDLFSNNKNVNNNVNNNINETHIKKKNKLYKSNKESNEQKQKEIAVKKKEEKLLQKKHVELFGEAEEDNEYSMYEDMFY
jgi:hypothetical protein